MGSSEQKNVFLAVILSGLVLVTWQAYFAPKPAAPVKDEKVVTNPQQPAVVGKDSGSQTAGTSSTTDTAPNLRPAVVAKEARTYHLQNKEFSLEIMDNLTLVNLVNPDVKLSYGETVGKENAFALQVKTAAGYQPLPFELTQQSDNTLVGSNQDFGTNVTINLDEVGRVNISLNSNTELNYRFAFNTEAKELENRKFREFAFYKNADLDNFSVGDDEASEGSFDWAAIDFNYHLMSVVLPPKTIGKYQAKENGSMHLDLINSSKTLDFSVVFAKKNYDTLAKYGNKLEHSVDFGFFAILAVPILRGLQFFYDFIPNYGIAIIFLTLIIRLITFPLQFKSFKSMKQMQKIQPDLAKLKEKYKDDPQRMQRETMELFKKAGANPLGGCLPMVLQMPVFFAFYQVLYNAYELVQAPFYFWITDLSIKDPFYVLPIVMGAAMFAQTKLNPSAGADPTQKKMMLFMPLIFTFIMKDLPAGLNLYIFVSTLFGIAQQLLVYKVVK